MARVLDFINRQATQPRDVDVGIGSFTMLVRVKEKYTLEADAPDTVVEDGSSIHDHIILKPLRISIEGDVSDVHRRGEPVLEVTRAAQREIGNITSQYAPARTQAQLSKVSALTNDVLDAARRVDAALDAGAQIGRLFGNQDPDSGGLQEKFLNHIEALYSGKHLIDIDMPYRSLKGMVITSFVSTTNNETGSTSFTLEAKKLQLAELQFAQIEKPASGTNGQTASQSDKGPQAGKQLDTSFLGNLISYGRNGI